MSETYTLQRVHDLRARVVSGGAAPTDEEIKGVVVALRQERMNAKPAQRGKTSKKEISLFDLSGSEDDA